MPTQRPIPTRFSAAELGERIQQTLGSANTGLSNQAQVGIELGPEQPQLHISRWHYQQDLHATWALVIEASGGFIADPSALILQRASFWQRDGQVGFHALSGLIQSVDEMDDSADLCHYRLCLMPELERLSYSRRERVFQRVTAVEAAQAVLAEHGLQPVVLRELPTDLARWRQLSQHRDASAPHLFETDLHFVRRILADQGLCLWLEPDEGTRQERLLIGRAGLGARNAKPLPLPLASPAGLLAPDVHAEQLLDLDLQQAQAPHTASLWGYNYRDRGRSLRSRVDTPASAAQQNLLWEEAAPGADALSFQGNAQAGMQAWLDLRAQQLAQRHLQAGHRLRASSNAAGLWRCGQALNLVLNRSPSPAEPPSRWLLTRIEAGSHLGPWLKAEAADDGDGEQNLTPQAYVHFEASPLSTWVQHGWMPELLPSAPLDLEQARISATPGSIYANIDPKGRYQIALNANTAPAPAGASSRPVRHIRSHAGADFGWHMPLHGHTEVVVAYNAGHPDTPMIAGALHNSSQPDLITGRNASRNVIRTWAWP